MSELDQPVAVQVVDLEVRRGGRPVVDGVSFEVARGEVLALRGVSGSGKTSVLGVLAGLLPASAGQVRVLGHDVENMPARRRAAMRRSLGFVFQTDELLPELTVLENVSLPLRFGRGARTTGAYRSQVLPLLTRLGIADLADRYPDEVSGGQLQRAAVARAVVHEPGLVLADEPTENLDGESASQAMELLVDLAQERGASVVVVTHDDKIAARADRELTLVEAGQPMTVSSGGAR